MIKSMTGFGVGAISTGSDRYNIEIRSVNARFLDIKFKGIQLDLEIEDEIRTLIKTILHRGTIYIRIDSDLENKNKVIFDQEKYEESKFQLERSIVYNPKHSNSYLYLGKIFKIEKNSKEEEKNINTSLLLDPKNEEAMYILIDLELERSNFSKVQDLKKDFKKICNTLCEKLTSIDTKLKDFEKKDAS